MLALNMHIFWTFFNLIVLYLLMRRFLFGPVNKFMENRTKEIEKSLDLAANKNKEADNIKAEYQKALDNAESEAFEILKNAKQNAMREYDDVLETAKKDAVQLMRDTEKSIALETQKAVKEMQEEIINVAFLAAEKAAEQNFDSKGSRKLIDEFLVEAGVER